MAVNLFTKTALAHAQAGSTGAKNNEPRFLICEQNDASAQRFMDDIKNKGGSELAQRVERVGTPKE